MATTPNEVFTQIGITLCQLQSLEEIMSFCLTAIRSEPEMTADELMALDATHRKATLGRIIRLMAETIEIDGDFALVLDRFLVARNLFVHRRFLHADFHPLLSPEACDNVIQFLEALQTDYMTVKGVFVRYAREIMAAIDPDFAKQSSFFEAMSEEIYGPLANPLNIKFTT